MADATPDRSAATVSAARTAERMVYHASGGRKLFFSIVFLLLLPFFASLPVMLFQRISHGLWFDTIGLAVMAAIFTALMLLVVLELIHALRARVELGERALRFTLPKRGGAPMFSYASQEIPYDQIQAVETRRELYGGSIAPVFMQGVRVVAKDGTKAPLGYVNAANVDPTFPFPVIASQIAERCGLPVTDRGDVRRSVRRKFFGRQTGADENMPASEMEIAALNRQHNRVMIGLIGFMVILLGLGIAHDFLTGSIDRGERARDAVQTAGKTAPKK